jgi:oxygen-independent coproporphyrinogen-3 oxidase
VVISRLMCDGEVDLRRIGVEHGIAEQTYFERELAAIAGLGELAAYDGDTRTIRTTALGRLLVRNICMVFDRYHRIAGEAGEPRARFSPTI